MPIEGNLKELSLVDFLQIIYMNRKSGTIEVKSSENISKILIKNGNIKFIVDQKNPFFYEEIKKTGLINAQIEKIMEPLKKDEEKVLNAILKHNINKDIIKKVVMKVVNERMFELLQIKEGNFRFNEISEDKIPETFLDLSTQDIILESSRRIDEWIEVTKKIPDFSYVVMLSDEWIKKGTGSLQLDAIEWKILSMVDGQKNISQIISLIKENALEIAKKICGLVERGILQIKEVKKFELELKKKKTEELFIKARDFLKKNQYTEAETFLLRAISLNPDFLMAHLLLGDLYYTEKQFRLAAQEYYEVIRRDPENPLGYYNLGFVRVKLGDLMGALEIWEKGFNNASGKMKEELETLVSVTRKLLIAVDSKRSLF